MMLGEAAREVAAGRDEHRDARQLTREHQRLVAGAIEIGADAAGIADDDDAVVGVAAPVAAAENGRALAHVAQPRRDAARRAASSRGRRPRGCRC